MNGFSAFAFVFGIAVAMVPPFDWVAKLNLVLAAINLSFLILNTRMAK